MSELAVLPETEESQVAKRPPKSKAKKVEWTDRPKKPVVAQLRGEPDFKAWLERAAARDRNSVSKFVERAVIAYARSIGFEEEAPER